MAFLKPEEIVKQLPLENGFKVADLGAGSGAFTIPLAKRVGKEGEVYAVDINQDILGSVKAKSSLEGLTNVHILWGDMEVLGGTKLSEGVIDLAIVTNVLFQVGEKETAIAEIKRILKPRGSLLVVDWKDSFGGLGPRPEDVVSLDTVKKLFSQSGFNLYNEIDAGEYHYALLFKKI